jgi:chemotaxis protein MotB
MARNNEQPIIVKKIIKGGHGHHGGSWKVAYADFVTAMMAFFMLLWLLNVTTDEQKKGIADYFSPASISRSTSGSGGILGGKTLVTEGARISDEGVPSVSVSITPPAKATDETAENEYDNEARGATDVEQESEEDLESALAEREEKAFQDAIDNLQQAIEDNPALADLGKHLLVDMTPEGLRIQLIDQDHESMFPSGSAEMHGYTRALLERIAQVASKLPNKIAISGHTDATPYRSTNGYSNWELSTDRANASRRVLLEAGFDSKRVAQVVGKADTEPLHPEDPYMASNRRISIVLLRERPLTAPASEPVSASEGEDAAQSGEGSATPPQSQGAGALPPPEENTSPEPKAQ